MENTNYKIYAKTNDLGQVTDIKTQDFAGDDWAEIGETKNRLYRQQTINEHGNYIYELKDGKLVERDTSADDMRAIKLQELAALDSTMPRQLEDVIDSMTDTQRKKIATPTLEKYNAKKQARKEYTDAI